jgi:hypothetical protein
MQLADKSGIVKPYLPSPDIFSFASISWAGRMVFWFPMPSLSA